MNEVIDELYHEIEVRGEVKGIIKGKAEMILKFMDVLGIGLQEAMDKIEIPASDQPMYAKVITDLKAEREKDLVH